MTQNLTRETLAGFMPAVVTPFTAAGEIVPDDFCAIVEYMLSIGASGICVAGDNGESWSLSPDERATLTRLAVDQVRGRVPVIMGATAPGKATTTAYAQIARDAGASGILVMPQTYVMKASRTELLHRFGAIAEATDIPVVLYNSPRRAVIDLSVDDIEAVMNVAPVVGIKESSRDFFKHTHLLRRLGDRISVMTGPSHFILPSIALGARGFIATGPELLGKDAGRIMDIGRMKPGADHVSLHNRLSLVYEMLMSLGTWPAALKSALSGIGLPAGHPRDPLLPLGSEDEARLQAFMRELATPSQSDRT